MRITLREIFLLVALVAVCCGWWVEHRMWRERDAWLWNSFIELSKRDGEWQSATGVRNPDLIFEAMRHRWLSSEP